MKSINKFQKWLCANPSDFYYLRTEIEKISSLMLIYADNQKIVLETQSYPKDTLAIYIDVNQKKAWLTVTTESSFSKTKHEIEAAICRVIYLDTDCISIETNSFEFSIRRSDNF